KRLQAWDDITLGGLGLVSAKIQRRLLSQQFPELAATASPSPGAAPTGGTPSPTPSGALGGSIPPGTSTPSPSATADFAGG
ncbi:MAG: hypothetical protein ABI807_11215, partial [Sporichthyaceae bacterium]